MDKVSLILAGKSILTQDTRSVYSISPAPCVWEEQSTAATNRSTTKTGGFFGMTKTTRCWQSTLGLLDAFHGFILLAEVERINMILVKHCTSAAGNQDTSTATGKINPPFLL